jgi:hypothetical protein
LKNGSIKRGNSKFAEELDKKIIHFEGLPKNE